MSEATETSPKGAALPGAPAETSILDDIINATNLRPTDEGYAMTKAGLQAFINELVKPERAEARVTQALADDMIATIDCRLSAQMDAILHHDGFQQLESAWRSLRYLVDQTDFRENIKVELLNVSKQDLQDDFEDATDITKSGLYKTVYTREYGQFGGQPYGLIVSNYEFGPGPQDVKLLQGLASVACVAHAPIVGAAGPEFFGLKDYSGLPNLKDLSSIFEMPQYTKWRSFRESEDARYVGLTLPHFLLRIPYGPTTKATKNFNYTESVAESDRQFLWGNAAFAFASRITDSFAKYRWCANIIGPQGGGAVRDMVIYQYEAMGELQTKIPTEVLISERREYELAEEGFISLTMRKGSDNAAFFSANSVQKPKTFGNSPESRSAETNYKLGTQLPYVFVVNRLAHYIKVIQRENIGTWKERVDLDTELNNWIRQYVADQESPSPGVRSRRPLRKAEIAVSDVEGDPGWYRVDLKVQPHFKYMGASFSLSLVGKLDKK
ncbi:type VI secretion system contractile sheath large subunit [Mesoterricola silvestris]|uniref:Type VI secretion protein n=1 Tax=Mesoterricola silvestris TaxID=2927979 RepID=A0AA48GSY8_9BACT|nr:type VI secretion system contractile sheath large subunit [Mesoterricola silvestris]BDU73725.1 type VI secretion protein [Mesoterricola silvestris]